MRGKGRKKTRGGVGYVLCDCCACEHRVSSQCDPRAQWQCVRIQRRARGGGVPHELKIFELVGGNQEEQ